MNVYKNKEGYPDPTAGAAISRIIRHNRQKHRKEIRRYLNLLKELHKASENKRGDDKDESV